MNLAAVTARQLASVAQLVRALSLESRVRFLPEGLPLLILVKDAVQSVCKQRLCLHFGIQNIEFYSTTIYIFMVLEYNKLSRDNNQALQ